MRRLLTRSVFDPQEVDLNEVVREVLDILSAQAAARDVRLDSKLAQERLRVIGDRVQLQQVILNLIVNGIEAIAETPNGVREIACSSWASDGKAFISIRDTGPGIPVGSTGAPLRAILHDEAGRHGHGPVHCACHH